MKTCFIAFAAILSFMESMPVQGFADAELYSYCLTLIDDVTFAVAASKACGESEKSAGLADKEKHLEKMHCDRHVPPTEVEAKEREALRDLAAIASSPSHLARLCKEKPY